MTARTKLTALERAHTLLMITAGVLVGCAVLLAIPTATTDGITVRDIAALAASLTAAYTASFGADRLIDRSTRTLRRRLRDAITNTPHA